MWFCSFKRRQNIFLDLCVNRTSSFIILLRFKGKPNKNPSFRRIFHAAMVQLTNDCVSTAYILYTETAELLFTFLWVKTSTLSPCENGDKIIRQEKYTKTETPEKQKTYEACPFGVKRELTAQTLSRSTL